MLRVVDSPARPRPLDAKAVPAVQALGFRGKGTPKGSTWVHARLQGFGVWGLGFFRA